MKNLSLKIPDGLAAQLELLAVHGRKSKSELVRNALTAYFAGLHGSGPQSSFELACDLAGSVSGPVDLSANQEYMQGFGH